MGRERGSWAKSGVKKDARSDRQLEAQNNSTAHRNQTAPPHPHRHQAEQRAQEAVCESKQGAHFPPTRRSAAAAAGFMFLVSTQTVAPAGTDTALIPSCLLQVSNGAPRCRTCVSVCVSVCVCACVCVCVCVVCVCVCVCVLTATLLLKQASIIIASECTTATAPQLIRCERALLQRRCRARV
jgi:hypothetical protein